TISGWMLLGSPVNAIAAPLPARARVFMAADNNFRSVQRGVAIWMGAAALLQNTMEQVAIAVPAHFGLAIFYGGRPIMVPVLGGLFCLGRFLFWSGYARGAVGRAFGFALTFYPSVGALLLAIWLALS